MKARLYQRNVLDGEKKMRVLYPDMRKEYRRHILSFIALMLAWCVLSVLLRVLLTVLLGRHLARLLHTAFILPLTVYLSQIEVVRPCCPAFSCSACHKYTFPFVDF